MQITYTLTTNTYSEAMKLHFNQQKKSLWVGYALIILFMKIIFGSDFTFPIFLLTIVLGTVSYFLTTIYLLKYIHKINFTKSKFLHSEREMKFLNEEFRLKTDMYDTHMKYDIIKKIVRDENYMLLYVSNKDFHIVPLGKLTSEEREELSLLLPSEKIKSIKSIK